MSISPLFFSIVHSSRTINYIGTLSMSAKFSYPLCVTFGICLSSSLCLILSNYICFLLVCMYFAKAVCSATLSAIHARSSICCLSLVLVSPFSLSFIHIAHLYSPSIQCRNNFPPKRPINFHVRVDKGLCYCVWSVLSGSFA